MLTLAHKNSNQLLNYAMHTLPHKLIRLRDLQGLSQVQMAFFFGVSQAAYCNWEKNEARPTWDHLDTIAAYYKVSVTTLLESEADDLLVQVIRNGLLKSPIKGGGGVNNLYFATRRGNAPLNIKKAQPAMVEPFRTKIS